VVAAMRKWEPSVIWSHRKLKCPVMLLTNFTFTIKEEKSDKEFSYKIPKAQEAKTDKWDYIKLKSFCATIKTEYRDNLQNGRKISASCSSEKEMIFKI
jgi:hypothetical protein